MFQIFLQTFCLILSEETLYSKFSQTFFELNIAHIPPNRNINVEGKLARADVYL